MLEDGDNAKRVIYLAHLLRLPTYFFGLAKTSHLAKSLETKRVVLSLKSEKKAIWGKSFEDKKFV